MDGTGRPGRGDGAGASRPALTERPTGLKPRAVFVASEMALIRKLKRLIGLDGESQRSEGTSVPVEREPAMETERAVKEPVSESADAGGEPAAGDTVVADDPVDTISGIGPAYAERLAEGGITTVGELAAADAAELADSTGLGEGRVANWIEATRAE